MAPLLDYMREPELARKKKKKKRRKTTTTDMILYSRNLIRKEIIS